MRLAHRAIAIALAALGLLLARPSHAELPDPPLPADPALARLIADSLAARPEIAQSRALADAEREQVPQAGALPDPMLQLGIQNDGFTSIEIGRMDTSFVSIMASQTFPWPGKRGLRAELAGLGAAQARHAVVRLQLSTEADVRRAYLELVLARDRLALLDALAVIWQNAQGVARARYVAGDGAQSDVLRAQLELDRLQQRRLALGAEERSRVQQLNRLRAHPLDEAIEAPVQLRDLAALAGLEGRFVADRAVARSPELAAARLGIARAGRAVALAGKSAYPDVTVSTGVMIRGALPPRWAVSVGGPLPGFAGDKQRREVAEDEARASAARSEAEAIEQLIRLRVAERRTAFTALVATIELYQRGLLVQSQATTESTLAQYKVGKVSFASVLEANAGFIADQDGFLAAVAAAHRLLIANDEISLEATMMPAETRP
jgi:cobalt-zinc-cadmium efflux system outer membrane protein